MEEGKGVGEKKTLIQIKNKPYSIYIVSTKKEMSFLINKLNGLIRIKAFSFKKSCDLLNITYLEPEYKIKQFDPYFSGFKDTDGSLPSSARRV